MTNTPKTKTDHVRLFLPGPVEVRPEILEAQTEWMIGHRSGDFADLYARIQPKLQKLFGTEQARVYIYTSSGSGVWESASRCAVRDDKKILHLTSGSFSERWTKVSRANGKTVHVITAEWGKAVKPEQLEEALQADTYDAVACVYNETSTGVLQPVPEYAEIVKQYDDTLFLVDMVSGFAGAPVHFDDWGLDVALTSTQKAFALPPGMAFGAVSDRVLDRAEQVEYRGYYFDMLQLEKYHKKNNTPATPPISLMYATDRQLDDIMQETIEGRVARHQKMAEMTQRWATSVGFGLYAEEGYRSPTLTTITNTLNVDVSEMNKFLRERGMVVSNGYGAIKNETIRIAHMGDTQPVHLERLFEAIEAYLQQR
jgi:predicted phosphoserine aminotransferase